MGKRKPNYFGVLGGTSLYPLFLEIILVGLVADPAWPAKAGAGCLFGPAGLGGKILKYLYLWNLKH